MNIKATKITEAPRTELVANIGVTGTGPAAGGQSAAAGQTAATGQTAAAAPRTAAAAPPPQAASASTTGEKPKKLPTTASPLPLLGLIGIASLVAAIALTARRRGI
jgi:hypothetical protein